MAQLDYSTCDSITFHDDAGRRYEIGPGRIEGDLQLYPFVLPGALTETEGCFRLTFDFVANDRQQYRYSNLFGPTHLWIPAELKGQQVRAELPPALLNVRAELDSRESYIVRYDDGTALRSRFYYTGVQWLLHEPRDQFIPTSMSWYYLETASMQTVFYDLDVRRFLWRPAPTYANGGSVTFESAAFVSLALVGTQLAAGEPTDITVTSSTGC